jgi:RHS repeat-associated protein
VTDTEGNLIWRGRYSTFGKVSFESITAHTPRGFTQNLRMQGQYEDKEVGLCYNTFRYYDADIGRFTTEDPIGLLGGINLYQYAPNPLSWIDPWGWACGSAADTKVIGRLEDTAVAKGWAGHDVLNIRDWTLRKNDAWVQSGISNKQTFYIASPTTRNNLVSSNPLYPGKTVFARELGMLTDAGYTRVGDYMVPPK